MLLLSQTFLGLEKRSVIEAAQQFGDEYFLANASGSPTDKIEHYPTGQQNLCWKILNR